MQNLFEIRIYIKYILFHRLGTQLRERACSVMVWVPRSFRPTRRDVMVACISAIFVVFWLRFDVSLSETYGDGLAHANRNPQSEKGNYGGYLDLVKHPRIPDFLKMSASKSGSRSKQIMPSTTVIGTAPGWTLFENLYMSNGALLIISDDPPSSFPDPLMMTSTGEFDSSVHLCVSRKLDFRTGAPAENTPENIKGMGST